MIYNIYPTKDATIYSYSASMNTGMDPILEIEKTIPVTGTINKARTLIQFDWGAANEELGALPGDWATAFAAGNFRSYLHLHATQPENIAYSYKLEAIALGANWEMGIGKKANTPITEKGVTWGFTDNSGSTSWAPLGGMISSDIPHANIMTQSFEGESTDIKINVSESIAGWHLNSNYNNGLLLRITSSQEDNTLEYGTLKFFSRDSNTIYSPKIQIGWDDSIYHTGSMTAATSDEIMVYIKNNKYEYKEKEVVRVEVRARDIYPTATYATTSAALDSYYLPTGSYYSIKDAETEEAVIDFNTAHTKMSTSGSGHYFDLAMNALTAERLYKIVLKVDSRNYNGQVEYFDSNHVFKVVR
jgi:hypothetical protein